MATKIKVDKSYLTEKANSIQKCLENEAKQLEKINKLLLTLDTVEGWEGNSHTKYVQSFTKNRKSLQAYTSSIQSFVKLMKDLGKDMDSKDVELKNKVNKIV